MTKAKKKGPKPAPEGTKCYFADNPGANSRVPGPECSALTEDEYCSGCGKYICDNHTINPLVMGHGHGHELHNEYEEDLLDDDADTDEDGDDE